MTIRRLSQCVPKRVCWTILVIGVGFSGAIASAQLVDDFDVPRANCCLLNSARNLADQLQDWNQLGRYHQANEELKREPAPEGRVVFMGDSITDGWNLTQYFPDKPYVNRGISGQTTPQMLVRMYPDVIDLTPAAMVVLAGKRSLQSPRSVSQLALRRRWVRWRPWVSFPQCSDRS